MKFTPEQLQEIEEYAGYYFTDSEIALIMKVEKEVLLVDAKDAIDRGRLISEVEFRKSVFEMAKNGSAPAQTLAYDIMKSFNVKNVNL